MQATWRGTTFRIIAVLLPFLLLSFSFFFSSFSCTRLSPFRGMREGGASFVFLPRESLINTVRQCLLHFITVEVSAR